MSHPTLMDELLEDTCPDMPVCSCGSCDKMLVTAEVKKKHSHFARGIDTVFLRARGVPFCRGCSSEGEVRFVLNRRFKPCPPTPSPTASASR